MRMSALKLPAFLGIGIENVPIFIKCSLKQKKKKMLYNCFSCILCTSVIFPFLYTRKVEMCPTWAWKWV